MKPIAFAVCLLAALASQAGSSTCPETVLLTGSAGFGQGESFDAAEGNIDGGPVIPGVQCIACFSWPFGYFRASGYTGTDWGSSVGAAERFELVGPATTVPLNFSARLLASGSAQLYGEGSVGISEDLGATNVLNVTGPQTLSNVPVVLNLQHFAGESFILHVDVAARSVTIHPWIAVDLQALFAFTGLPEGWSIVSCRDFDVPVPAKPMTWGALRAMYR